MSAHAAGRARRAGIVQWSAPKHAAGCRAPPRVAPLHPAGASPPYAAASVLLPPAAAGPALDLGRPWPLIRTASSQSSFTFVMKTPPATILIKKAAGIKSGSAKPHTDKVGKITRAQAEEIAKTKMPDLTAADMEAAVRTIAGSARSMGITVEGL